MSTTTATPLTTTDPEAFAAHLFGAGNAMPVEMARRNAAEAGVADRVRFHLADGAEMHGSYDAGVVVVMDEAVAEVFDPPGDDLERLRYGLSLTLCPPCPATTRWTGTVIRPSTLRAYAQGAGFRDIEILPIEDFGLWRCYELIA